jgi:hypothetical protein
LRLRGLKVALSGTDLRGPEPNSQITPSVSPSKWQLAQVCQPSLASRSLVCTEAPAGRLKFPRDEKNISAPTATVSSCEPGAGSEAVRMVLSTWSVSRSTTETLRDTKLATQARLPERLITMPCGSLPALSPLVAGLAGSLRSM